MSGTVWGYRATPGCARLRREWRGPSSRCRSQSGSAFIAWWFPAFAPSRSHPQTLPSFVSSSEYSRGHVHNDRAQGGKCSSHSPDAGIRGTLRGDRRGRAGTLPPSCSGICAAAQRFFTTGNIRGGTAPEIGVALPSQETGPLIAAKVLAGSRQRGKAGVQRGGRIFIRSRCSP